ncbi:MAG: hypothetical protein ACSHX9_04365 [Luteolibacter sp.]
MNIKAVSVIFSCLVILLSPAYGSAELDREWTSVANTKMKATALELVDGVVTFERESGGKIQIPLDQLAEADRVLLQEHFFAKATEKTPTAPVEGLPHPQGKVVGPIKAGNSNYFLYIPKNLTQGRLAPMMFFTGAGGGNAKHLQRYIPGAEVNGWILAASVESKNGRVSGPFIEASIEHIKSTLPVDPARFYFTGGSGGGVRALVNTTVFDGAGTMPVIAHGVIDDMPSSNSHYYFVSGATDYNRSASAVMRKNYKDNAFHRFHAGAHANGPNNIAHDGMAWLNGRFLAKQKKDNAFADEREDYEKSMIAWISELAIKEPHRALLNLKFLLDEYVPGSAIMSVGETLRSKLSEDSNNTLFVEAIYDIDEFSQDELSSFGVGSLHKHSTPGIKKAADQMLEKYQGIPEIPQILENLKKPTI